MCEDKNEFSKAHFLGSFRSSRHQAPLLAYPKVVVRRGGLPSSMPSKASPSSSVSIPFLSSKVFSNHNKSRLAHAATRRWTILPSLQQRRLPFSPLHTGLLSSFDVTPPSSASLPLGSTSTSRRQALPLRRHLAFRRQTGLLSSDDVTSLTFALSPPGSTSAFRRRPRRARPSAIEAPPGHACPAVYCIFLIQKFDIHDAPP